MTEQAHVQSCKGCGGAPDCHYWDDAYHIMCEECHHGVTDKRLDEAVKLWNREYWIWMTQ